MSWITYYDPARLLWDALPDDEAGAIGSNWRPTTRDDAERFVVEMTSPEAIAEGWSRGHWTAPRF
jgi:hypothetical protein